MKPPFEIALKYLDENERAAVVRPSVGGGDAASEEGNFVMRTVSMHNGRDFKSSLEQQGFELRQQATEVENFYDDAAIADIYEKRNSRVSP